MLVHNVDQLVKRIGSIKTNPKEIKSIPIWNQFHQITLDTIEPLLETHNGNKYILIAIDHYFKWVEAQVVMEHDAKTTTKFLEDEINYRFGVPRYILTDNGSEWAAKFD